MSKSHFVVLFCCFLFVGVSTAQDIVSKSRPHVMIVGLYHMDNPGRDLKNINADDVLSPKRQQEIAAVVALLKKFRPTKIAIEAPFQSTKIQQRYEDYLAGTYTLTRNETDQIGFRLAQEMNHGKIYPVDVEGDFPFEAVQKLARQTGQENFLNAAMAQAQTVVAAMQNQLDHGTILQALRFVNTPAQTAYGQTFYMAAGRIATKDNYAGPNLLTAWYERNARIYANLRMIMDSPDDRVLVLYGSGHNYWLQRDVLDAGDLVLEQFGDYR